MSAKRACSWHGCTRLVLPSMWGCKAHWYQLPKPIRDRIWATYQPGQETDGLISSEYWDAYREAMRYAQEVEKTKTWEGTLFPGQEQASEESSANG